MSASAPFIEPMHPLVPWPASGPDAQEIQDLLDLVEPPAEPHLQWAWCPLEGPSIVVGLRWQTDEPSDELFRFIFLDKYIVAEAPTDGTREIMILLERPLLILPSMAVRGELVGRNGIRPTRFDGFQRLVSPRFAIEWYARFGGRYVFTPDVAGNADPAPAEP